MPTAGGRFVPAQALLLLVAKLQQDGQAAMGRGEPIPWTAVRIVDTIDKKELGEAITASDYARKMVQEFIEKYKFQDWKFRATTGEVVTDAYKSVRAIAIAEALCSHERWKSHGHAINREVLQQELQLKIEHPVPDVLRAMTRAWALLTYTFEKTTLQKLIVGPKYTFVRSSIAPQEATKP